MFCSCYGDPKYDNYYYALQNISVGTLSDVLLLQRLKCQRVVKRMFKVFKHRVLYMRMQGCVHILFTKRNRNIIIFGTREVIDGQSLGTTAYALWGYTSWLIIIINTILFYVYSY